MSELREQIREIERQLKLIEKIKVKYNRACEQKEEIKNRLDKYKEILEKENKDVNKLEKMSLARMIHTIIGDREEKIKKEKEESYLASLKYDEARNSYDRINSEIKSLEKKINDEVVYNSKLNKLREEIKDEILESDSEEAKKIRKLENEIDFFKTELKEIEEAIQAAKEVISSVKEVERYLDSARNWGTYDMLGGGMIATMAKHSKIEEAKRAVDNTQYLLRKLNVELSDLGDSISESLELGQFTSFADYFFDGIFFDWQVQSKINDARNKAKETRREISNVLDKIVREKDSCLEGIKKNEENINQILS